MNEGLLLLLALWLLGNQKRAPAAPGPLSLPAPFTGGPHTRPGPPAPGIPARRPGEGILVDDAPRSDIAPPRSGVNGPAVSALGLLIPNTLSAVPQTGDVLASSGFAAAVSLGPEQGGSIVEFGFDGTTDEALLNGIRALQDPQTPGIAPPGDPLREATLAASLAVAEARGLIGSSEPLM